MKFNINEYKDGKDYIFGMHCKTEEEALDFCKYLHSKDRAWISKISYNERCNWHLYEENTLYYFNEGTYGPIDRAHKENAIILEWSDYMYKEFTKADLKTGDVVKFNNGEIGLVFKEFNTITTKKGYLFLDYISNDLMSSSGNYTIKQIRRSLYAGDCSFQAFDHKLGKLIYDRDAVVEMTMEEICAALGKNIKIVKSKT